MKLEEQVLSIEQAKHLIELGLDMSDAALAHVMINGNSVIMPHWLCERNDDVTPAYTLEEILKVLPEVLYIESPFDKGTIREGRLDIYLMTDIQYVFDEPVCDYFETLKSFSASLTLKENAYHALCWVIENGYLEGNK